MSNIHGLGDAREPDNARGQNYSQGQPAQAGGLQHGIPLTPDYGGLIPSISERLLPRFNVKTLTFGLSVVEVIVFAITLVYAGMTAQVFDPGNEMAGPSATVLFEMGGKFTPCIVAGQVWRLVTPIFLHAGLMHLLFNLIFQLHFGFTLERRWGPTRFFTVYMITGVGASLLSAVGSPSSVSVGASGALFGLLGADLIYLVMNWPEIPGNSSEMCVLCVVIVLNFIMGVSKAGPGAIDNWAHLGGLLTGIFCGPIVCPIISMRPKTRLYQGVGTFVWLTFFITLSLLMFLTPVGPCPTSKQ